MSLRSEIKRILGTAWHVAHEEFCDAISVETDGTAEAGKPVIPAAGGEVDGLVLGSSAAGTLAFFGSSLTTQRAGASMAQVTLTYTASNGFGFTTSAEFELFKAQFEEMRASLVGYGLHKGAA